MRMKTKLFLGIFLIAFLASGATGSYFYYQANKALLDSIRQQLRATATISALLVDGDVLQTLTKQEHMATEEYRAIQELMGVIAQSTEEYLFAYTMRLDQGTVRFIVDSPAHDDDGDGIISEDELPEPIGAVYPAPPEGLMRGFVKPSSDRRAHTDQWDTTLSGYAPIHDRSGRPVGLIGIDMSMDRIESKMASIRHAGFISLALAAALAVLMGWYFSRSIFHPLSLLQNALIRVGEGDYSQRLDVQGKDEIADFAATYNKMVLELREKNWIKASLGKMIGKEALKNILDNRLQLGGEIQRATIMVCDLRGFSQLSEKLPPKLLVGLINDYFTVMVEIIQRHGGIVDKFVGDMILAVFGHPAPLEHEQRAALNAAREMIAKCDELNVTLHLGEDLHLENSVALHSGFVLAGNIGSPDRMEYTIMGHAVNVAVRLERLTRWLHVRLAASEDFVRNLDGDHNLVHSGSHTLPGMHLAVEVYAATDGDRGEHQGLSDPA
jgi:class 3 adenylate cyclase